MLSQLRQLLSKTPELAAQTTHQTLHTHQIETGDDKLTFSIPHNFSPDFPPKPMPETVSISDNHFEGDRVKSLHVWRAWWDYWTPGHFSREIGSLMLSIDAFKIHPEFKRDIFIRENLTEAIQINLINTYAEHNKEVIQNGHEELEVYLPNTHFPQPYVATVSCEIDIISETLNFEPNTKTQAHSSEGAFPGYDLDLWPELWAETHADELKQ